jgi:hypothetical protein
VRNPAYLEGKPQGGRVSHQSFGTDLIGRPETCFTKRCYLLFRRPRAINTTQPISADAVPTEFMSISGALVGTARQVPVVAKTRSAIAAILFIFQVLRIYNFCVNCDFRSGAVKLNESFPGYQ